MGPQSPGLRGPKPPSTGRGFDRTLARMLKYLFVWSVLYESKYLASKKVGNVPFYTL